VSDKLRLVAGSQENHGLSPAPMKEKNPQHSSPCFPERSFQKLATLDGNALDVGHRKAKLTPRVEHCMYVWWSRGRVGFLPAETCFCRTCGL